MERDDTTGRDGTMMAGTVGADVGVNVGADVGINVGADAGVNVGADVGINVGAEVQKKCRPLFYRANTSNGPDYDMSAFIR